MFFCFWLHCHLQECKNESSMAAELTNPFGQSHAIHCSEPLNPRREPLQLNEMTLIFII